MTFGKNLDVQQALSVRDQWKNGRIEIGYVNPIMIHPQMINPDPPIVADARFRSALMRGLNRQEMVDTLMLGFSAVADRLFDPRRAEYEAVKDSVVYHPYDPRVAAQMLESLGYTRGADGGLRDPSGQRLSVEIRSTATVTQMQPTLAGADDWQRLGVEVITNPVPQQLTQNAEYMTTFPAFRLLRGDPTAWDRMRIASIPLPENNFRGNNYNRYRNQDLEALITRYFVTIPSGERLNVVKQLVNHVTGALNVMTFYFDSEPMFIADGLRNAAFAGCRSFPTWSKPARLVHPAPTCTGSTLKASTSASSCPRWQ